MQKHELRNKIRRLMNKKKKIVKCSQLEVQLKMKTMRKRKVLIKKK